ncbi:YfbU family protein [Actinosynnema sp. NPDC059335]|uniref:YfbU family protein n=1 Tax=Actinosynnema sp. NPDC059335 TaxID=3346804 RepID=UPI00367110F8
MDDTVRDELDRAARARGTTVSDLLRNAINDLLGFGDDRPDRGDVVAVPRTLDTVERRTFALLHEVLGKLSDDEDDRRYHGQMAEVMTEGFAGEYHDEFGFMPVELSPTECSWANDILEMFRVVEHRLTELTPEDRERLGSAVRYTLTFDGFDLSRPDEARLLAYVRYMVTTDGRWEEFRERVTTGERGNSHSPRLARYQRMRAAYEAIRDRNRANGRMTSAWDFDIEDLLSIVEAARHPGGGR